MSKKSKNKSLSYYFVEPLHQRKGFLGLLMMKSFGSIVIALFVSQIWFKIWLLEKGGYSLTQKNNIIFYLRNIVDIIV